MLHKMMLLVRAEEAQEVALALTIRSDQVRAKGEKKLADALAELAGDALTQAKTFEEEDEMDEEAKRPDPDVLRELYTFPGDRYLDR